MQQTNTENQFLEFPFPPTVSLGHSWRMPEVYQSDNNSGSLTEDNQIKSQVLIKGSQALQNEQENLDKDDGSSEEDSLIDESGLPSSIYIKPKNRPFKDIWFSLAYTLCFLIMVSAGLVFVASKSTMTPVSKTLFLPLWNSAGM